MSQGSPDPPQRLSLWTQVKEYKEWLESNLQIYGLDWTLEIYGVHFFLSAVAASALNVALFVCSGMESRSGFIFSLTLLLLSMLNAWVYAMRTRSYQFLRKDTLDGWKKDWNTETLNGDIHLPSPNMRLKTLEVPDATQSRSVKVQSFFRSVFLLAFRNRKSATTQKEYVELLIWDPHPINAFIFQWFSPAFVAMFLVLRTCGSIYSKSLSQEVTHVVVYVTFLLGFSGSLGLLTRWFEERLKDQRLVSAETVAETQRYAERWRASGLKVYEKLASEGESSSGNVFRRASSRPPAASSD
mmetsp:Transcript_6028/g.10360  ORF Transcript_6028/g.10360 Transcript_6028/m.10360 type:complete len:299 (+) Transcript_6028:61-957(+)|eukprot:CAMPEP_0196658366 /NCGR_PEP_ID=MMETSP1086-20130531/29394_1 /TAXON_ID=77921 /ORGANISM="Cyanoptyche  gloeocystis , Strain SAG4.97" /LENGTH=298 /DNA_ID=CAMNT_0041991911 /DNA_START=55 /DNA_END=951 /DNA_ORIENTATION=-